MAMPGRHRDKWRWWCSIATPVSHVPCTRDHGDMPRQPYSLWAAVSVEQYTIQAWRGRPTLS